MLQDAAMAEVAAMASVSHSQQPMTPSDMQEEGDRKTNLIVNYLPQTMTQVSYSLANYCPPILLLL